MGGTRNVQILDDSIESFDGRRHLNCQNLANLDMKRLAWANPDMESEHPDMDYLALGQAATVPLASADSVAVALVFEP